MTTEVVDYRRALSELRSVIRRARRGERELRNATSKRLVVVEISNGKLIVLATIEHA